MASKDKSVEEFNTLTLARLYPEAFAALASPYQNDDCLTFSLWQENCRLNTVVSKCYNLFVAEQFATGQVQ